MTVLRTPDAPASTWPAVSLPNAEPQPAISAALLLDVLATHNVVLSSRYMFPTRVVEPSLRVGKAVQRLLNRL